jgi:hypothetical protein
MVPTQPSPRMTQIFRLDVFLPRLANSCTMLVGLVFLFWSSAHAQASLPLVAVATDQSSFNLSNQFGVPAGTAINQAGDFAFVGNGGTALFVRTSGALAATRLLQIDDEVPGFPSSRIQAFLPELGLNSLRSLLFGVRFNGGANEPQSALLIYDGANYRTVASSQGIAPGSGGGVYGAALVPGSIDDNGDVDFASVPSGTNTTTFYIVPSGGTAVRIVSLGDTPPTACTWCSASGSPLQNFFSGAPAGAVIFGSSFVPGLNAKGQMLLSLWGGLFIGSKDGGFSLVPMASTGVCSPQPTTTGTPPLATRGIAGFLNNNGVVAYTNPSSSGSAAICVAPAGGGSPIPAITAADPAPAGVGGTMTLPSALGLDDSGDIIFQSPISGGTTTTFALLRYHQSTAQSDVVAYNCEQAPGTNGSFFSVLSGSASCGPGIVPSLSSSAFGGVSMANDGSVSFNASLTSGGNGIYRQSGAGAPEFISLDFNGSPLRPFGVAGSISSTVSFSTNGQTKILNNGSVFFASYLASGAADFAVFLGTPGHVQSLMSTADLLPSGARTILGGIPPQAAGHFVAFTALPAAGRINLLESDLTTGTITHVISDNDPALAAAGGPPGNTVLAPNFFLNEGGQIVFETVGASARSEFSIIQIGSGAPAVNPSWLDLPVTCGTIYLWSPSSGLKKVVAAGDAAPTTSSATFTCVTLNETPPSPLNQSGEVVFSSPSPMSEVLPCSFCGNPVGTPPTVVNGDFLYDASGVIREIASANDTLPGADQITYVPSLSVPVNATGQVAFGAGSGTNTSGFYLRNGAATQKVIANGDPVPGSSATFGFPHFIAGLADSDNLAFTSATSSAADGLFFAPAGGAIQTIALDGGAAPGGGTFSLTPNGQTVSNLPPGTVALAINSFKNFATINGEADVAFGSSIIGGSADSGYFRLLQSGTAAGTLQPVVLQGQAVPGGGTFNTLILPNNVPTNLDANFALGPDGTLAFLDLFTTASGIRQGMFIARPDGILMKVAATGDFLPGGGVLAGLSMSTKLAAGDAGKFAFLAGIVGGNARRAIFVTAIPPGTAGTTITLSQLQSPAVTEQPVTLTVTVTSATAGTPTGAVTFFDDGISLGTSTLNSSGQATLTTSSLAAGQASIIAQYVGDSTFSSGNSPPLVVVVAGFSPPPTPLAVTAGQSLVIPLTLFAPTGSAMSFTLSCSGLPAKTICMFDVNPVAPGPSGTTIHLTFATTAGSELPPIQEHRRLPLLGGLAVATLLAALLAAATLPWHQALRWRLASCACLALFALVLAIGGCGAVGYNSSAAVSPGTPAGPATFTVTGTSGTTTISAVLNVTVR